MVVYSPLARGVLTAKYRAGEAPEAGSRAARADRRMMQTEYRAESLQLSQAFKAHAERRGVAPSHLAIAWALNNRLVAGVIGGPRTLAQWQDYLAAMTVQATAEDEAFVDGTCDPPEVFTYGGMLAHVLTFAAHRRTLALGALYSAGSRDLAPGDPMRWVAHGA